MPVTVLLQKGHARRAAVLVCDLVLGLATRAVVNEASDGLRERLNEEINAVHVAAAGLADGRLLGITAREKGGELCAELFGWTWSGCGYIEVLWVRTDQRGRGLSDRLLAAAEQEIRRRGCD